LRCRRFSGERASSRRPPGALRYLPPTACLRTLMLVVSVMNCIASTDTSHGLPHTAFICIYYALYFVYIYIYIYIYTCMYTQSCKTDADRVALDDVVHHASPSNIRRAKMSFTLTYTYDLHLLAHAYGCLLCSYTLDASKLYTNASVYQFGTYITHTVDCCARSGMLTLVLIA
jgi:hypothetical protein